MTANQEDLSLAGLRRVLRRLAKPGKAKGLQGFFKTGPGEYAEGDQFIGVMVRESRAIARRYRELPLREVTQLLRSPWHEERLVALFILVDQFQRGSATKQQAIYELYLRSTPCVNNWDLVDSSAAYIVGPWLARHSRTVLLRLARSRSLWERRIAIVATHYFIRRHDYRDTLRITKMLLGDGHHLIHKACGWMLREVGQRDVAVLERFLQRYASRMPRTMLRYAIEKFSAPRRRLYLRM
ncbi:MAG: DNA alkylation repair protein [Candidatus Acidiferrales bacterium]